VLSEAADHRARAIVAAARFCANAFVTGCDADAEIAYDAWRVFVRQYRVVGTRHDYAGLDHSYVVLDRVGNCLANIPARNSADGTDSDTDMRSIHTAFCRRRVGVPARVAV
jgi:hypothetical protein